MKIYHGLGHYNVHIGADIAPSIWDEYVEKNSLFFIIDQNFHEKYLKKFPSHLGHIIEKNKDKVLIIKGGEVCKNLKNLNMIWNWLGEKNVRRQDLLMIIGGGALLDLGAFSAATWMRGIGHILVPTTLLAMVDAGIGGKTAINIKRGKNMVGAFHQPFGVIVDRAFLATLPTAQIRSGFAEIIKTAMIGAMDIVQYLPKNPGQLMDIPLELIEKATAFKGNIVMEDEKEGGKRKILNYGHTLGHSLEKSFGYGKISHGEAISVGMDFAVTLGVELGETPTELVKRQRDYLIACGLFPFGKIGKIARIDTKRVALGIFSDKKGCGKSLDFVILDDLGRGKIKKISFDWLYQRAYQYLTDLKINVSKGFSGAKI